MMNRIIPEGWKEVKLGELGKIVSGGTPDTNNFKYWNGNIAWLTPSEVTSKFINKTERTITETGLKNSSAQLLPVGSLLICTRATVGSCCINTVPIATNQGFKSIIPKNSEVHFLYYLLSYKKKLLIRKAAGSTFLEISKKDIENLKLVVPPLSEQITIARILSEWDNAIDLISRKIELKKRIKKGLMQRLMTGKVRLRGFRGGWQERRFDSIFMEYSIRNKPNEPLLSSTQERGVILRSELEGRVMSPKGNLCGYKFVEKGSFVISLRSFQGGLEYSNYSGIISPAYTILKKLIKINEQFFKYFFKSYVFIKRDLAKAVIGIRDGKTVSYSDLKTIKIYIPTDPAEQTAIAEIFTTADDEISFLNKKLEILKLQKKGLMQKLLTGEWSTRNMKI